MALKSLYRVCVIKNSTLFSIASVLEVKIIHIIIVYSLGSLTICAQAHHQYSKSSVIRPSKLRAHPSTGQVGKHYSRFRDFKCALIREDCTLLTHHLEVYEDRQYGFLDIIQELKKASHNRQFLLSTIFQVYSWRHMERQSENCVSTSECSSVMKKRCIVREAVFAKVDQACYEWFMQQCSRSVPITGPILREIITNCI